MDAKEGELRSLEEKVDDIHVKCNEKVAVIDAMNTHLSEISLQADIKEHEIESKIKWIYRKNVKLEKLNEKDNNLVISKPVFKITGEV